MQLQPLAGENEQRGFTDVQDGIADALQELRREEMRDEKRGILPGPAQAPEGLGQRVAVLTVKLGLAAARVLGLLGVAIGEARDDLVERGQRRARGVAEVEGRRFRSQPGQVQGLLGDVDRIVAELLQIEGHAKHAAQATAMVMGSRFRDSR